MKKGDDDEGEGQNLFYRQASSKAFEKSNQVGIYILNTITWR